MRLHRAVTIALAMAALSAGGKALDASDGVALPVVGIAGTEAIAAEGGAPGVWRIRRVPSIGDLEVRLVLGGDAKLGEDFTLDPAEQAGAGGLSVQFKDGQEVVDLRVEALDDSAAEADETVQIALGESEAYSVDPSAPGASITIPRNDFTVTTARDAGEGSLRQAILNANEIEGPDTITFDTKVGPFSGPQTITLESELPALTSELTIDGYIEGALWRAVGVTVSGAGKWRVFSVEPGARVTLRSLTVADGSAKDGGGVANSGVLVVAGVTFKRNEARRYGGALFNGKGTVTVLNSTFSGNRARKGGGGLADRKGTATVTNCTFSDNTAKKGGALFSDGTPLVRNTILANSGDGSDCWAKGDLDPASSHNLIESSDGCGEAFMSGDPRLVELDGFNGPTHTMPLGNGSPAINMGDNAAALDENGEPLVWDQRGNGDPRFVAGYTDIGAVETQGWPWLQVDTLEDSEQRSCTRAVRGDCSLRGAIALANAMKRSDVITFDPVVFAEPQTLLLDSPLPELATAMTLDAGESAGVKLVASGPFTIVRRLAGVDVKFKNIVWDGDDSPGREEE